MEVSPNSLRRARICPDSMRARVAHAGCSTATTSTRPSTRCGRRCPTQLAADQLVPAGEHGLHHRRRRCRPQPAQQARHGVAQPPRAAVAPPFRHRVSRLCTGRSRATTIPSGSGAAVVRIDWPAGSSATRARLRAGSSSEKTSSSSRVGMSGVRARTSLVHAQAQGQGQAALLALRGVGPGLPPVDLEEEVVPVGPHRVDAPAQVVLAGTRPGRPAGRRPSCAGSAARREPRSPAPARCP